MDIKMMEYWNDVFKRWYSSIKFPSRGILQYPRFPAFSSHDGIRQGDKVF